MATSVRPDTKPLVTGTAFGRRLVPPAECEDGPDQYQQSCLAIGLSPDTEAGETAQRPDGRQAIAVCARCESTVARRLEHVTDPQAKGQLRVVLVTYRQHMAKNAGDDEAAAMFRERTRPILDAVESALGSEPEIAELLADLRRELGGDAD